MARRYTNTLTWEQIVQYFDIANTDFRPDLPPNYNAAPEQILPVVRRGRSGRELAMLQWGLRPSGSRHAFVNATAEKVAKSAPFRDAFAARRCLVPADGFFEWRTGLGRRRQPYRITLADERPFAIAGLWENAAGEPDQQDAPVYTFCLITTTANDVMRPIHHRMPAILDPDAYDAWLDGAGRRELLKPFPAAGMSAYQVSIRVNDPGHNDIECVTPIY